MAYHKSSERSEPSFENDKIIVIGAGPSGLAFSYRYGQGSTILEMDAEVGGLSRSIELLDGVFDIGGHSFHTPHEEVQDLVQDLMKGRWFEQKRDARVWVGGELIPYPFQHYYHQLTNQALVIACDDHQADHEKIEKSTNFEEWIVHRFGSGISQHFMLPYNRKIWAGDLKEMSCDWVGQRVATDRTSGKQDERERKPLQSGSCVAYPASGGFGEIFKSLAQRCPDVQLSQEVMHIDLENRNVTTRTGEIFSWSKIVSTIPLPILLDRLSTCPPELKERASELKAVSLKILLLLIHLRDKEVPQRIYVSDPDIPPHKVAFNHTSSPGLASCQNHAVMCEVSYSDTKPALPDDELIGSTINWLISSGYISSKEDLISSRVVDVPYGYPVNTHSKREVVGELKAFLEANDIYSVGRFGAWDYANSDECIRQGLALADQFQARVCPS